MDNKVIIKCLIVIIKGTNEIGLQAKLTLHSVFTNPCFAFIPCILILRKYTLNEYYQYVINVPPTWGTLLNAFIKLNFQK